MTAAKSRQLSTWSKSLGFRWPPHPPDPARLQNIGLCWGFMTDTTLDSELTFLVFYAGICFGNTELKRANQRLILFVVVFVKLILIFSQGSLSFGMVKRCPVDLKDVLWLYKQQKSISFQFGAIFCSHFFTTCIAIQIFFVSNSTKKF